MNFSGNVEHITIFSWMLTNVCCLVVRLRLGLHLVSGWLVVMHTHLYYFALLSSNSPQISSATRMPPKPLAGACLKHFCVHIVLVCQVHERRTMMCYKNEHIDSDNTCPSRNIPRLWSQAIVEPHVYVTVKILKFLEFPHHGSELVHQWLVRHSIMTWLSMQGYITSPNPT